MYMNLKDYTTKYFDYTVKNDFYKHLLQGHFYVNGEVIQNENHPLRVGDIVMLKYKNHGRKNVQIKVVGAA